MPEGIDAVHTRLNEWLDEGDLAPTPEQRLRLHQFIDEGYVVGYDVGGKGLSDEQLEQRVLGDVKLTARIVAALDSKVEEEIDRKE